MVGFVPRNDSFVDSVNRKLAMNSVVLGNIIDATRCGKEFVERNSFYKIVIRRAMTCLTERTADQDAINPHAAILALRTFSSFVNQWLVVIINRKEVTLASKMTNNDAKSDAKRSEIFAFA